MLTVARAPGVTTLTLDRPELGNALGPALVEALIAEVAQVVQDDTVHTLVLRATGRHFCTGLDLSGLEDLSDGDLVLRLVRIETLLSMLWHAPLGTAALAQGRTWGAGADLFAACEQRMAAPGTTFRFPGAQFGIVLGTRRLAERIGVDAARRLVLEGGELDATRALAAGLASSLGDVLPLVEPLVTGRTAAAIRAASRPDRRDTDLAALVRSAAAPGLGARIARYRERLRSR
jgi:enoyl-CoA hydratase/carnithine racemase